MSMWDRLWQAWDNRPAACARRVAADRAAYAEEGITEHDVKALAEYNGRCSHGIVHTAGTDERMADLQERFDRAMRLRGAP